MIEEFIANLIYNRKRYLYGAIAFVTALLLVTLGIINTVFIIGVTYIGYLAGSPNFRKKLKKIKDIINESRD